LLTFYDLQLYILYTYVIHGVFSGTADVMATNPSKLSHLRDFV